MRVSGKAERIHLRFDAPKDGIEIGYVGSHLPTKGRSKNNFRFSSHGFDGVVPFGEDAVRCDA